MNGSLNFSFVYALNSLTDAANCSHVTTQYRHPRYLDVEQRDVHAVDEVQVDVVVGAVRRVLGARHSEGDLAAHECEVCSALHLYAIGNDSHFLEIYFLSEFCLLRVGV